MRPTVFSASLLRRFLRKNRIATLPQLKHLLGRARQAANS